MTSSHIITTPMIKKTLTIAGCCLLSLASHAAAIHDGETALTDNQQARQQTSKTIKNGDLWPDDNGRHINAHGGGIMKYGDTYYWFGEHKDDHTCDALVGVMCYASKDLLNWHCCGVALSVVDEKGHDIERGCILERPKA